MPSTSPGRIRIGTSGWIYPHWNGLFYPREIKAAGRFAHYAGQFDTVEINGSFYRLPSEAAVQAWARQAPADFLYAWKVSRYITHNKKLKDVSDSIALVFGRMAPLGAALGPALFQLPPNLKPDRGRLAECLALLPAGRHVFEFRSPAWYSDQILDLLAQHGVALCISDHHHAPAPWVLTADFAYVRGHGPGGRYIGRYGEAQLARWAQQIATWAAGGRDVYAYFDNDIGGAAPVDALWLRSRLV